MNAGSKITQEELRGLFGEAIPMEAFILLNNDYLDIEEIRSRIQALADSNKRDQREHRDHFYHAYGSLLRRHTNALREDDEDLRARIFDAIELWRELYPESVDRFERDYPIPETKDA